MDNAKEREGTPLEFGKYLISIIELIKINNERYTT